MRKRREKKCGIVKVDVRIVVKVRKIETDVDEDEYVWR